MSKKILERFAERVGYSPTDLEHFQEGDPRLRQMEKLAKAAPRFSIEAKVVKSRHCNSGYQVGDRFILDVDGNFIAKLCPQKICVYLASQLIVPVALINERLSESLDPNSFHFMHFVKCLDAGVECSGFGEVMLEMKAVPRVKHLSP
jgi:uncharacterized repeat protein (TIGR04076 family)